MAGRPRSSEADAAILDAALAVYGDCGYGGLCVEVVAARAGVSKATIYRRYASKLDLVMASTEAVSHALSPLPDTGSLRGDLLERTRGLRDVIARVGPVVRRLIADRGRYPELDAAHASFVAERRAAMDLIFGRAVARGEIAAGADVELLADLAAAPLFYRFLVHGEIPDDAYVEHIVDAVLTVCA